MSTYSPAKVKILKVLATFNAPISPEGYSVFNALLGGKAAKKSKGKKEREIRRLLEELEKEGAVSRVGDGYQITQRARIGTELSSAANGPVELRPWWEGKA